MGDVTTDYYLLGRVFEGEINLLHYSYGHPERSAETWVESRDLVRRLLAYRTGSFDCATLRSG